MKFKKEEIVLALRAAEFQLNCYKKIFEEEIEEEIEDYDPNDITILEAFIIPALRKGLESLYFDSEEQMEKCEAFLCSAIRDFLNENAGNLDKIEYGIAVKLYLKLENRYISYYEGILEPHYWWENEGRIIKMREAVLNNLKKWSFMHNFKVSIE